MPGVYRLQTGNPALYVNDAGCGNVLALERPPVLRLALEALRTAVLRGGVDGFRYDLAPVLGRRENGFDPDHPLFAAIAQDPWLKDLIHIAEPWDVGPGGYRLGAFPAAWGEWNDQSRDGFRHFWRGDPGSIGALATRLAGSADIFASRHRPLSRSINFVTAHDGFTLADLVAFETKRNAANGEDNRDGTNANLSWNCGAEGPATDANILARRAGDVRALLVTLFAARGTPMLSMGDELGRSQGGNNNAYAQDNALAWIDWASMDVSLVDFVARLIRVRRSHGALNRGDTLDRRAARRDRHSRCRMADAGRPAFFAARLERSGHESARGGLLRSRREVRPLRPRGKPRRRADQCRRWRNRLRAAGAARKPCLGPCNRLGHAGSRALYLGG